MKRSEEFNEALHEMMTRHNLKMENLHELLSMLRENADKCLSMRVSRKTPLDVLKRTLENYSLSMNILKLRVAEEAGNTLVLQIFVFRHAKSLIDTHL